MTHPTPPDFIPPDLDDPNAVPRPAGATDAGLGGELVTDVDEVDEALDHLARALADHVTATVPGAPTWPQVYALAKSMVAKWAPGRRGENVNDLTYWYYGTWSISAAFCFIGICYVLCHAISRNPTAAQQQAALDLLGGKKLAYVPYIRQVPGYTSGHAGMRVGAIVAVGGFEHIGICVGVDGSSFLLWSANSTDGDSDDAITIKRYALSAANGYANLAYPSSGTRTNGDDPVIGLKKGDKGEAVTALQVLITYAGQGKALGKSGIDGEYGDSTAEALRLVRKSVGSDAGKGYGDDVTGWAYAQLMVAVMRAQSKH